VIYKLADNILSPLGDTTEQNYQAVLSGGSAHKVSDPAVRQASPDGGLALCEHLAVASVRQALASVCFDIAGSDVVFVLSTTKGNVEMLGPSDSDGLAALPGESARRMAQHLGVTTTPIVVCNACISGSSAIILAGRLLAGGWYRHAIVCGVDMPGRFITSGFESLKALSAEPCRPFDMERTGMNLGEAAATIILSTDDSPSTLHLPPSTLWQISCGAIRNDAYDILAPSRQGEGAYRALAAVLADMPPEQVAQVSAHGAATLFMDQMESVAIERAGLSQVPVNSLKGYFGHTLGAAGVLETVLTMRALDDHVIIGTRGFGELGVSGKIRVSAVHQSTDKTAFVKLISGFGGGNAALLAQRGSHGDRHLGRKILPRVPVPMTTTHQVRITPMSVMVDDRLLDCEGAGKALLTSIYRRYIGDYPRYYKMDLLSRLGFVASELLLGGEDRQRFRACDDRAVILFNYSSSICADRSYLETIGNRDNCCPSPSLFVYTLPNIVTGEIAMRNRYHGETSFYILPQRDETVIRQVQQAAFRDPATHSMISGWIDCQDEAHFEADLYILQQNDEY